MVRQRFFVAAADTCHGPVAIEQAILPDTDFEFLTRAMHDTILRLDPMCEGVTYTETERYTPCAYL